MIEVPLTEGRVAIIDEEDAERVLAYSWQYYRGERGHEYARATVEGKAVYMHRFILGAPHESMVDHRNGNGLNNRRANLRLATYSQNGSNRERQRNNKTGFKGVSWDRKRGKFRAAIMCRGTYRHLGYFSSAVEAARAYDIAAVQLHGEFATLNFPRESVG